MKNKLIIGRYLPMQSIIHQLDPRAKLIFVFFFYSFNFFLSFTRYICMVVSFIILFIKLARIPFGFN